MKKKTFRIFIGIMAVVLAVLIGLNSKEDQRKDWDTCYEMANANISWQQTYYPGAWNSD